MSKPWGHVQCPNCDFTICVHEDGWHLHDDTEENEDFEAMENLINTHHASHQ